MHRLENAPTSDTRRPELFDILVKTGSVTATRCPETRRPNAHGPEHEQ